MKFTMKKKKLYKVTKDYTLVNLLIERRRYMEEIKMLKLSLVSALCQLHLDGVDFISLSSDFYNRSGLSLDKHFKNLGFCFDIFVKTPISETYDEYRKFILNSIFVYQLGDINSIGEIEFNQSLEMYQLFILNHEKEAIFFNDCYSVFKNIVKNECLLELCNPALAVRDNLSKLTLENSSYSLIKKKTKKDYK